MCCCGSSLALALALEMARPVEPANHTLVDTVTPCRLETDVDQSHERVPHRFFRWLLRALLSSRQLRTQWSASM